MTNRFFPQDLFLSFKGGHAYVIKFGKTSLTLKCEARNKMTRETIVTVDNIIMVNLDNDGKPTPHHKTQIEFVKDRLK